MRCSSSGSCATAVAAMLDQVKLPAQGLLNKASMLSYYAAPVLVCCCHLLTASQQHPASLPLRLEMHCIPARACCSTHPLTCATQDCTACASVASTAPGGSPAAPCAACSSCCWAHCCLADRKQRRAAVLSWPSRSDTAARASAAAVLLRPSCELRALRAPPRMWCLIKDGPHHSMCSIME